MAQLHHEVKSLEQTLQETAAAHKLEMMVGEAVSVGSVWLSVAGVWKLLVETAEREGDWEREKSTAFSTTYISAITATHRWVAYKRN